MVITSMSDAKESTPTKEEIVGVIITEVGVVEESEEVIEFDDTDTVPDNGVIVLVKTARMFDIVVDEGVTTDEVIVAAE